MSEFALGHANNDATRAAYARDELLPHRARLMQDWADYCARPHTQASDITPIRQAASVKFSEEQAATIAAALPVRTLDDLLAHVNFHNAAI
ncbi:MAG: hypothetical protein U5P41_07055 [Gammaproteobacteria bacterium]|nr:hypothetical protein [Gammaproteobacteria bacterium]